MVLLSALGPNISPTRHHQHSTQRAHCRAHGRRLSASLLSGVTQYFTSNPRQTAQTQMQVQEIHISISTHLLFLQQHHQEASLIKT